MTSRLILAIAGIALVCSAFTASAQPAEGNVPLFVYVARMKSAAQPGEILLLKMDPQTGALSTAQIAAPAPHASSFGFGPDKKFLYAVNETDDAHGMKMGAVSAFAVNDDGTLTHLNDQPSAGKGPCFVEVDHTGKMLLCANYGDGIISSFPIQADGKLAPAATVVQHEGSGPNKKRQDGPHAHCFFVSPNNRFGLSCDLGTDKVMIYKLLPDSGKFEPNDPPEAAIAPGSGPRHLAFHPNHKWLYVITELGNTVVLFDWDGNRGAMHEVQTVSALPADFHGTSYCAEVLVHPNGKFLYATNRGHNSVAIFSIEQSTGALSLLKTVSCAGDFPRYIQFDPSGKFLLLSNEHTGNLVVFRIDPASGDLTQLSQTQLGSPLMCIRFLQK